MVPSLETAHRKDSMTCDIKMRETRGPLGRLATKILIFFLQKRRNKGARVCFYVSRTGGPADMMNAWSYTALGSWVTERQTEAEWIISVRAAWKSAFTSAPITSAELWIWRVRFIWNPIAPDVGIWSLDRHQEALQFCRASKSVFISVWMCVSVCVGISASIEVLNDEAFE